MADRTVSVRLQAEIGQYVAGMTKAAAVTKGVGSSAASSGKQARAGFDLAGKGAMLLGAGVGAALVGVISKSMQFDKAMSAVGAATQATGSDLLALREAAMKAGADTQFSATEAANAITEMAKAGVSAKDIMGGGLNGALALAAAGQMEVADAAGIASVAMTQFNLSGKDLPHVADLLAAGAGKAMGEVSDLGAALNQAGLIASGAGLSIEETTGTLSAFASAGLIGSDAGTSFKTMLQRLQAPVGDAADLMKELGISLYDANGQTLGMSEVAGQLNGALNGMTPAARDSALAVMFGSDAVRAANVLYKEGAGGIADWTAKVDDQGFAAKQAAALTDNLSGDIERLGGSFDTLLITLGEGAQGPLRELVQMLGGIVDGVTAAADAWGNLPGPVKVAIAALGGVALLKSPMSSAFETIALKAMYAKDAFVNAATGIGRFKSAGAGLMGVFGGPWGLAITGAAVGLSLLVDWLGKTDEATDQASEAQTGLQHALEASKGAIDANVRAAAAKVAQDEGMLDVAERAGIPLAQVTDAILHQGNAYNETVTKLMAYRDARVYGSEADKEAAAAASGAIAALQGLSGQSDTNIVKAQQLAAATEESGGAAGGMTQAAKDQTVAAGEAADAIDAWREHLATIATAFVDPLSTYKTLLGEMEDAEKKRATNTAETTADATDSWEDHVRDVDISLDQLAARLEEENQAREDWRKNVVKVTQRGGSEVGQILLDMGEEGADITAKMAGATKKDFERMKAALIANARAGGRGAATELDRGMAIMAAVGKAGGKTTARQIADQLHIGVDEVARIAAGFGIKLAAGVNPIIGALGRSPIDVAILRRKMAATGGYITGPGSGTSDSIPAMLSNGEYVIQAKAVQKIGTDRLDQLNQGRLPESPGFATGGFVSAADVPKPPSMAPYRSPLSTAGNAVTERMYAEVVAYVKKAGVGGPGVQNALRWAKAQVGKPYIWGGVGPAGYDCSGFMSAITNVIKGKSPYSRLGSTASFPWSGFADGISGGFSVGSTRDAGGGIGHMAGTLGGVNVESYGGHGPAVGNARGASDGLFNTRAHLVGSYRTGTPYVPRDGLAYVHKGEAVVPASVNARSREFAGGGSRTGGGTMVMPRGGLRISGTVAFDPAGMLTLIDARLEDGLDAVSSRGRYNP